MADDTALVPAGGERLKIDFGDGVSALDRLTRAIVMVVAQAIDELTRLGYERDYDMITVASSDDEFPDAVSMRGVIVFQLLLEVHDGQIVVDGVWIKKPKRRGPVGRFFSRRYRA